MPDVHIRLYSCNVVLPVGQHSVNEVEGTDVEILEPSHVSTDFAQAEQVQIASNEAFRYDAAQAVLVPLLVQHFLNHGHIVGAHTHLHSKGLVREHHKHHAVFVRDSRLAARHIRTIVSADEGGHRCRG